MRKTKVYVNDDMLKRIVSLNGKGFSDVEIASKLNIANTTAVGYRKKLGLPRMGRGGRFSVITKDLAIETAHRRNNGESTTQLAKEYKCHRQCLMDAWKRHGLRTPTFRETWCHNVDMDCFERINDSSAYWLGFVITDGHNQHYKGIGRGLIVVLSEKDRGHLEKLKVFAKYDGPIATRTVHLKRTGKEYKACSLRIGGKKMSQDLVKWGITHNKSFTATAHPLLAINRHFWRGVIDGNGCIRKQGGVGLRLVGSWSLMNQYAAFVQSVTGRMPVVRPNRKIFEVGVYGSNARKMLGILYRDCDDYLDRKRTIALARMEKTNAI